MGAMTNPALNPKVFQRETAADQSQGAFEPGWGSPSSELPPDVFAAQAAQAGAATAGRPVATGERDVMRVSGTVTATTVLLLILMVAGVFGWNAVDIVQTGVLPNGDKTFTADTPSWIFFSWIATLGLAIVTILKPRVARFTAPLYAVCEGMMLGSISAIFEASYPGIVVQAVLLTFGVFFTMLVMFATGTIRVTQKLRMCVIASMFAIMFVYLADIIAGLFGASMPLVDSSSPWGIGFSLLVVVVASLNLLLNFDFVKWAIDNKAPRYMEWYAGFGLMLALVWLYLEILRLLSKLRN